MTVLVLSIAAMVLVSIVVRVVGSRRRREDDVAPAPIDWDRFMRDFEWWAAAQRDLAQPDEHREPPARDTSRRDDAQSPER